MPHSSILLPEPPFFRHYDGPSGRGMIRDGSSLAFIAEEMIASGALEIGVRPDSIAFEFASSLPSILRERFRIIKDAPEIVKLSQNFCSPILEELELIPTSGGRGLQQPKGETSSAHEAATSLYFTLENFLIGMSKNIQVEYDLDSVMTHLAALNSSLRDHDGRSRVSILSMIFNSYTKIDVDSLTIATSDAREKAQVLWEILEDDQYRALSETTYLLGLPRKARRAVRLVSRRVRHVVESKRISATLALSRKSVSTALSTPDIEPSLLRDLLFVPKYFPPLIEARSAVSRAYKAWSTTNPDLLSSDRHEILGTVLDAGVKSEDSIFDSGLIEGQ